MADYKFAKDKLAEVIGALEGYEVFAPHAVDKVVRFKPVEIRPRSPSTSTTPTSLPRS